MPEWGACLECGGAVAAAAASCPHCQTRDHGGLTCAVCLQAVRPSAVAYLPETGKFFHLACLTLVKQAARPCGCGVWVVDASRVDCPNCGGRLAADRCRFCAHPFSPAIEDYGDRVCLETVGGLQVYRDLVRRHEAHRVCAESRGGFLRKDLYRDLYEALLAKNWRAADVATDRLMRYFAAAVPVAAVPLVELQQIDDLWTSYSGGRFGFSIQARLWQSMGGGRAGTDDGVTYGTFAESVGWQRSLFEEARPFEEAGAASVLWQRVQGWLGRSPVPQASEELSYDELQFDLSAPPGHLPFPGAETDRDWSIGREAGLADGWDVPAMAARFLGTGDGAPDDRTMAG